MNRIYRGKVTAAEIHVPGNKEKPWQPFDPESTQAKAKWQSALLKHHELFQDAMPFLN